MNVEGNVIFVRQTFDERACCGGVDGVGGGNARCWWGWW